MDHGAIVVATARSEIYGFLARAFTYPTSEAPDHLYAWWKIAEAALEVLPRSGKTPDCAAGLSALTSGGLRESHVACFGHAISKDCPPYETEYGQAHIFQKTQTLADISGFYRAFGLAPSSQFNDRLDHIAVELEFLEFLCRKEAYALANGHSEENVTLCRQAQRRFLGEHLACWVPGFVRRVQEKVPGKVYTVLAELLDDFLTRELQAMGLERGCELPLAEAGKDVDEDANCMQCPMLLGTDSLERGLSS